MFCEEIVEMFEKIPGTLPKPVDYIKKTQMLLTDIWCNDSWKNIKKTSNWKANTQQGSSEEGIRYKNIFKNFINIGIIEIFRSIKISLSGFFPEFVVWRKLLLVHITTGFISNINILLTIGLDIHYQNLLVLISSST